MPRRRPTQLSVNHERWLVSYSDFMTLLFAFFVVMYSISQVNESKYRVLSDTLEEAFKSSNTAINPIQIGDPTRSSQPSVIDSAKDGGELSGDGAFENTADLPQLQQQFESEFSDLLEDESLQIHSNEMWLEVELKSSILFSSGSASPSQQARDIFDDVANMLSRFDNPVQVEGFTDNLPISTAQFPSNWELSASRAAAVVKLLADSGVSPGRLSAVGYGEHHPIADNATVEGREKNRRVVLMIAREQSKRPRVQSESQIADAVTIKELSTDEDKGPKVLTAEEVRSRMDALFGDDSAPVSELDSLLDNDQSADVIVSEPEPEPETQPGSETAPLGDVQAVELDGGGLLFTSDPEKSRDRIDQSGDDQLP